MLAQTEACADSGDSLDAALEQQSCGHIAQAEPMLRRLAEADDIAAMERLALLHWYGDRLYGSGAWQPTEARRWFERTAGQGSEVARHMLQIGRRDLDEMRVH